MHWYMMSLLSKYQVFGFFPLFFLFIYSEKAPKFCKTFPKLLSYVVTVKSKVEISQNFVAFSEYMKKGPDHSGARLDSFGTFLADFWGFQIFPFGR